MTSVPAQANALAGLEKRNVGADRVDDAGNLVAGGTRKLKAGPMAFFGQRVAMADAAGLDADADVSRAGLGKFLFDQTWNTPPAAATCVRNDLLLSGMGQSPSWRWMKSRGWWKSQEVS